ncbi:MAG TPA: arginine deiminase family protein [Longimicrobiales bacterium]
MDATEGMQADNVRVTSEIGPLRAVICHTPGPELLAVTPATREDFLYDDIIDLDLARREHQRFKSILARFASVYEVSDLLDEVLRIPEVRHFLVEKVTDVAQSEPLARQLLDLPPDALRRMFIEGREIEEAGALAKLLNMDSYDLPPLPNLYFTRDAAMVVNSGVIIGSMRYTVRWTEEILMKALFRYHPTLQNQGLVYDGSEERRAGYTVEGGDVHVLRPDLVVVGMSERSSPGAFDIMAANLMQYGVTDVLAVIIPTDRAMIHLDMIFTMIDRDHCVVFAPSFVGPTRCPVLHWHAGRQGMREMPNLFAALREVDLPLEPVFCGGQRRTLQEREQWSSGCNFVAVKPGVILGYSRNEYTYIELEREAGYRIIDGLEFLTGEASVADTDKVAILFEGAELVRGGGGSRCMTMPICREDIW